MDFCFSFIIFAKTIRGNNRRDEGDYARLINLTNLIPSLLNNLREGFFLMQNSRCKIQLIGDFFEIDTHSRARPSGDRPSPPTEGWGLLIIVLQKINSLRGLRSCRAPLSSHCANFGKSERVIFAVKKCDRLIASNARSDILGKNHA